MSARTTILLFAAVLALGIYIGISERFVQSAEERQVALRQALQFDAESIIRLRISSPSGLLVVQKTNEQWRLMHPVTADADPGVIMRLLDVLTRLRWSQLITSDERSDQGLEADQYGLNPPRITIALETVERTNHVYVGRDTADRQQVYLAFNQLDDILVANRDFLSALPGSMLELRNRRLVSIVPGRIRRMEWQSRDELFQASRTEDDQWQIERPVRMRGANSVIQQWLVRLYEFRIQDFVAESMAAASLYGLDTPTLQLTLTSDGAAPYVLKIGHPVDLDKKSYYATIQGQESVFTLSAEVVGWLLPDMRDFRDHRLLPFPPGEINRVEMTDGEQTLQLIRNTQSVWEVTAPKRFIAHEPSVQTLLTALSGAMAEAFVDAPPPGLISSGKMVKVSRNAASGNGSASAAADREIIIHLGATNDQGQILAVPAPGVYGALVSASLLKSFTVRPLAFREPDVMAIDAAGVQRISQRQQTDEWVVEQSNGLFRAVQPGRVPDTDAIFDLLGLAARLTTDHFVEEDPRDLTPYGLDQPYAQISFAMSADGSNRVLLIGSADESGNRYAMRQGTDLVFTLAPKIVERLLKPVSNSIAPAVAPAARDAP